MTATLPAGKTNKFEEALRAMGGVSDSVKSWPIYRTISNSRYLQEVCQVVGLILRTRRKL